MVHESLTFLLELAHRLKLKKNATFQKPTLLPSSGKDAPSRMEPSEGAILSLGTIETLRLLSCVPENRSHPRVVTGKQLGKNNKKTTTILKRNKA